MAWAASPLVPVSYPPISPPPAWITRAQHPPQHTRRIFADISSRLTKYDSKGGKEIQPGIIAIDTSGHTQGHTSFIISSRKDKVGYRADVISGFALFYVANPGWHPGGDMNTQKGEQTRRRF